MTDMHNCGPYAVIDGPPPAPARYGLLQAAAALVPGVRFVSDDDRWLNGVKALPYPQHLGATHSPFDTSGSSIKEDGEGADEQKFFPFTAYVADKCSAYRLDDDAAYQARIMTRFASVESPQVAHALLTGDGLPVGSPRLSDGEGEFPVGNTAVSLPQALGLLENEIARARRAGVIHMSPRAATLLAGTGHVFMLDPQGRNAQDVIYTRMGTLVIPDQGYVDGATPAPSPGSHPAPSTNQEWLYASGPIELRRSDTYMNPPTLAEALDRGLGATNGEPNTITYRAERDYLISYDNLLQAAVLANYS